MSDEVGRQGDEKGRGKGMFERDYVEGGHGGG